MVLEMRKGEEEEEEEEEEDVLVMMSLEKVSMSRKWMNQ